MTGAHTGNVGSAMGGGCEFAPQRRRAKNVGASARTSLATWMAWVVAFSAAAASGPNAAMAATCPTPAGPANMVVVLAPVPYYSWNQCERALPRSAASPDSVTPARPLAGCHRKRRSCLRRRGGDARRVCYRPTSFGSCGAV